MDEDDTRTDERERVRLAELSWPDVEAAFEDGVDTIVLPLGATEQHGPHLPLDTDTRLATELAERVAQRLGDALVAPVIPVGPSREHEGFPGTISASPETLTVLLEDYVASFERQGFDQVVVLPAHGGSFPVVDAAFPDLAREADVDVVAVTGLRRYADLLEEGLQEAGIDVAEPVVHAGASETAMVLAIAPKRVADDLPEGYTDEVSAAALFAEGVETHAENGVLGDARPATAEVGETLLEHVANAHAAYVSDEFAALDDARYPKENE
jgi:creatinine amidohydrolase